MLQCIIEMRRMTLQLPTLDKVPLIIIFNYIVMIIMTVNFIILLFIFINVPFQNTTTLPRSCAGGDGEAPRSELAKQMNVGKFTLNKL